MKIIFLDIDGVIAIDFEEKSIPRNLSFHIPYMFTAQCVSYLNRILYATKAEIVLSSSWRLSYWDNIKQIFQLNNIYKYPIDKTPKIKYDEKYNQRGDEINLYLHRHPEIEKYVILDDDNDFDRIKNKECLFLTETDIGLTSSITDKIIKYLRD